jgi:hypothetical protein
MKVHLRADEANGTHTKFTVFMNGGNCGQLCMSEHEAVYFHEVFIRTIYRIPEDQILSSGIWSKEKMGGNQDGL